jgi:hypothetical protein
MSCDKEFVRLQFIIIGTCVSTQTIFLELPETFVIKEVDNA